MVRYVDLIKDASADKPQRVDFGFSPSPNSAAGERQNDEKNRETYLSLWKHLQATKRLILESKPFAIEPLRELVRDMIAAPEFVNALYQYTSEYGHEEDFTASHSINTMIYALKIGIGLEYPPDRLLDLGLAALLHDVGMFSVPDTILRKPGALTENETSVIRRHPETGRDLLAPWASQCPCLNRVAWEHHERQDGSGYPRRLKGDEISEFGKIVGLVDTYEAMTHDRPYRRALSVRELISSRNSLFSSGILKVFLEQFSLYPVGSLVRLNNRAVGKVIRTNDGQPLRPIVRLTSDETGNAVTGERIVDLKENPILWISGIIEE